MAQGASHRPGEGVVTVRRSEDDELLKATQNLIVLKGLIEDGKVAPVIGARYPLTRILTQRRLQVAV